MTTKEEFDASSPQQQEAFINAGGSVLQLLSESSPKGSGFISSSELDTIPRSESVAVSGEYTNNHTPPDSSLSHLDGMDFQDPVELLIMLDEDVKSGRIKLHPWQIQHMLDFADNRHNSDFPFQSVVRAPNESGKDKYVIAAEAVWACMRFKECTCPITSSSGFQLDNQTCRHIRKLCEAANRLFGPIWKLNYRNYKCLPTESEMFCYATDEAGKAEGFHPVGFGRRMCIFCSEDKSIPDDINVAINKCSGYTHRVHVSTPGGISGHFHKICQTAILRRELSDTKQVEPSDWIQYHITYKECSHIRPFYVEQMKRDLPGGEFGAAFQSQFMAEFGTTDEMVVISSNHVWKAYRDKSRIWVPEEHNKAGLDLADGGAENTLFIRNGNKMLKMIAFRFDNTEDTIIFLQEKFRENGLTHPEAYIFGDAIGIGAPMLKSLKRKGWSNIRFFDGRNTAFDKKVYKNRNSEIWFTVGKLFQQGELILLEDTMLIEQLSTRYYKIVDGKHQLLSKLEQKSRGYPSPDRADACVYSFVDYKSNFVGVLDKEDRQKPFEVEEEEVKVVGDFTLKSYANGSTADLNKRWNVNGGQKQFSELESEISDYNKQLVVKG